MKKQSKMVFDGLVLFYRKELGLNLDEAERHLVSALTRGIIVDEITAQIKWQVEQEGGGK